MGMNGWVHEAAFGIGKDIWMLCHLSLYNFLMTSSDSSNGTFLLSFISNYLLQLS